MATCHTPPLPATNYSCILQSNLVVVYLHYPRPYLLLPPAAIFPVTACPNYPKCDTNTGFIFVPDVSGAADFIHAQEAIIIGNRAPTDCLPGV